MQTVGEPNPRLASITLTDSAGHYRAAVPRLWLSRPLAPLPNFSDEQGMFLVSAADVDASQPGSNAAMPSFGGHAPSNVEHLAFQFGQTQLIDPTTQHGPRGFTGNPLPSGAPLSSEAHGHSPTGPGYAPTGLPYQTEPRSAGGQNTSPSGSNFELDPQALTAALAAVPMENSGDMTAAATGARTRRRKPLTDEDKAQILSFHAEKFSQGRIAEIFNVSKSLVENVINASKVGQPKPGVMTPDKGKRISPEGKAWILRLHNGPNPLSHQKIGETVGLGKTTVKWVIDTSKLVLPDGTRPPKGQRASKQVKDEILRLYYHDYEDKRERPSASDIAESLGVPPSTVRSVIKTSRVGPPQDGMRTSNGKYLSEEGKARILGRHGDPDKPPLQQIAEELGVPKTTLVDVIRRAQTAQQDGGNNASADTGAQDAPVGMPPQTSA